MALQVRWTALESNCQTGHWRLVPGMMRSMQRKNALCQPYYEECYEEG
jgi:hypothetical protein